MARFVLYSEYPTSRIRLDLSPHSANIDRARIEQQYGGFLAHMQPICARGMEFLNRPVRDGEKRQRCGAVDPA